MSPIDYFFLAFSRWNDFKGRSSRPEYWHFFWISLVVSMILGLIDSGLTVISPSIAQLGNLYSVVVILPNLALTFRRLHDIGKSPRFLLVYVVVSTLPFLVLLYLAGWNAQALFEDPNGPYFTYVIGWLGLVGLFSAYFVYLLAQKGDMGENAYGPAPHSLLPQKAEQEGEIPFHRE